MKIQTQPIRRFYKPAIQLLSATFALLLSASVQAAPAPLPDGTFPSNVGMQLKGPDMNAETLDKVKELGVSFVRRGLFWEGTEKAKGVYDFSSFDKFVAMCKERNFLIIVPLVFDNKLYGHPQKEPARSAYAAWAAAAAAHYKDENIYWELWNEPNTMTFWNRGREKDAKKVSGNSELYAEEYTNMVKATVPAMKKANPNCIILAGSVSNMWTESYKWMGYCFKEGMLKQDWDVWSVHPYGLKYPEDYIEAYAITKKLMDDAGGPSNRPWINSERGFPVDAKKEGFAGGDAAKLYEYQAYYLVRQYMIDLLEGVNMTCWYEWSGNEGFALYKGGTTIPAYNACKVLLKELNGYKLDKRIETKADRDFVLRFKTPTGATKLVVWGAPEKGTKPEEYKDHLVTIPVEASGTLDTADIYGTAGKVEVKGGSIEVMLTQSPQYITVKN